MPLTQIQPGSYEAASINTTDLGANVTATYATYAALAANLTPKISTVNVANSTYFALDDTAVNIGGGYLVITGSGFQSGAQVLIDVTPATSTTFVNSTTLRAEVPSKSAASYNLYITNPDGGTSIKVNGVTYSGSPMWVTASALTNVANGIAFTGNLSATGATSYNVATGSSLPSGFNLVSANGYYYGTINTAGSDVTYSFTIDANDNELQTASRTFSLLALSAAYANATGGTITTSDNYRIHTFTSNGTLSVSSAGDIEYLVVAGGGGGGQTLYGNSGSGGGAGGYRTGNTSIGSGSYDVVVGAGGGVEQKGSNSSFNGITSTGGGRGYNYQGGGGNGGSGGGGSVGQPGGSGNEGGYTPVEGYSGGSGTNPNNGAGGGGAGGPGGSPGVTIGGPGRSFYGTTYAVGGNGTGYGATGSAGGSNTGTGGGTGAVGGSGIVIVRYRYQ